MYWRSTRNIGKLFSCVRTRCIGAQLEILESYLASLEYDVIGAQLEVLESFLAALELDVTIDTQLEIFEVI